MIVTSHAGDFERDALPQYSGWVPTAIADDARCHQNQPEVLASTT